MRMAVFGPWARWTLFGVALGSQLWLGCANPFDRTPMCFGNGPCPPPVISEFKPYNVTITASRPLVKAMFSDVVPTISTAPYHNAGNETPVPTTSAVETAAPALASTETLGTALTSPSSTTLSPRYDATVTFQSTIDVTALFPANATPACEVLSPFGLYSCSIGSSFTVSSTDLYSATAVQIRAYASNGDAGAITLSNALPVTRLKIQKLAGAMATASPNPYRSFVVLNGEAYFPGYSSSVNQKLLHYDGATVGEVLTLNAGNTEKTSRILSHDGQIFYCGWNGTTSDYYRYNPATAVNQPVLTGNCPAEYVHSSIGTKLFFGHGGWSLLDLDASFFGLPTLRSLTGAATANMTLPVIGTKVFAIASTGIYMVDAGNPSEVQRVIPRAGVYSPLIAMGGQLYYSQATSGFFSYDPGAGVEKRIYAPSANWSVQGPRRIGNHLILPVVNIAAGATNGDTILVVYTPSSNQYRILQPNGQSNMITVARSYEDTDALFFSVSATSDGSGGWASARDHYVYHPDDSRLYKLPPEDADLTAPLIDSVVKYGRYYIYSVKGGAYRTHLYDSSTLEVHTVYAGTNAAGVVIPELSYNRMPAPGLVAGKILFVPGSDGFYSICHSSFGCEP